MSILDALLKLRQICCHPRLLKLDMPGVSTNLPSGKFDAFKDMISDIIDEGHKVPGVLAVRANAAHHPLLADHQRKTLCLP